MAAEKSDDGSPALVAEWPFPTSAALGSAVRGRGIEREIKARLAFPDRKHLAVEAGRIRLRFEAGQEERLSAASTIVAEILRGVDDLPVLPSEVDDVLTIAPRERLKWTRDGRLKSAGTRTVKLPGRAKTVTFHVFDPRHIEDVLDRDLPSLWREEDATAAAETRRRAAGKAAETRAGKGKAKAAPAGKTPVDRGGAALDGWDAFAGTGLLR